MDLNQHQFSPSMMPKRKVEPQAPQADGSYRLTGHAADQATKKGWAHEDILRAANDPHTTYENGRYPGQMRHIRGDVVAVVDPAKRHIVTAYKNVEETDLRPDQTDKDAQRYGRRKS